MLLNYPDLINAIESGESFEYLFFYGHHPKSAQAIDNSCFSQWYDDGIGFVKDDIHYKTAEHFMMAHKALLFQDLDCYKEILEAPTPSIAKSLGRAVKNFDIELWNSKCFDIVVNGNIAKFSQNESLQEYLLRTQEKVLVEASKTDCIWGIGMSKSDPEINNPKEWKGLNLLGFALMVVRQTLSTPAQS